MFKADGAVMATGSNLYGQLGDGTQTTRYTPVAVSTLTNVTAITAGEQFSGARRGDGTVRLWGRNSSGQIGDGTFMHRLVPTSPDGLADVTTLAVGTSHALAATGSGSVYAWGENSTGQIGDGTYAIALIPVAIAEAGLPTVATPAFSVPSGSYSNDLAVVVTEETAGAVVHYTLDGAEPDESDPVVPNGDSIAVSQSVTLKAKAWKDGMNASATASAGYALGAAAPVLTPAGGTFGAGPTVTASSATTGAVIRYTTNGSEPTAASPLWSGPLVVSTSTTVRTRALKAFYAPSGVVSETYQLNLGTLDAPTFNPASGEYTSSVSVSIQASGAASIRYTTDGGAPNESSAEYVHPLNVTTTSTIKAIATHPDYSTSAASHATFTIRVASPTLSPAGGTYVNDQNVTVSSSTPDAELHYTLDGADPTINDPAIASGGSIAVTRSTTLKVRGFKPGTTPSDVASGSYTLVAATPTFNLGSGTYTTSQTVTIATATIGATIYYTTDGTPPTAASPACPGQITVSTSTVVKAIALRPNYGDSAVATAVYTMNFGTLAAPTFDPAPGEYTGAVTVSLSAMSGATIRYTIDGTTPNTASAIYMQPLRVAATTAVKAVALHPDYAPSSVATGTFTIVPPVVATPLLSPAGGTFANDQDVTVSVSTAGAALHYTVNGADPTEGDASVASGGSIQLSGTTTLKVRGFKSGMTPSSVVAGTYTFVVESPAFTPAAGTYSAAQTVTLTTNTAGAVIRYTMDGSDPTSGSAIASSPIGIATQTTVKAKAFKANYTDSTIAVARYTFDFGALAAPAFDPPPGTFPCSAQIALSTIAGATIRYTDDGSTPTGSSTLYVAPLVLSSTTTIKAMAFHPDYSTSTVGSATYTVDTAACTPPAIVASVSPSPNAFGWHGTTPTVSFTCTQGERPLASCTSPRTVSEDGIGIQVRGEAVDDAGNVASVTVILNVDRTNPILTINAPRSGAVVPTGTTSVTVRGSAADSTSGIGAVTCAGTVSATLTNQAYTCAVAVQEGSNTVHVEATDLAGHVAGRDITFIGGDVPPTAIEISPKTMTMLPGEKRQLWVTDDLGRTVVGGSWAVSQPLVAQVSVDPNTEVITVTAGASGETTLSLTLGSLAAEATVVVSSSSSGFAPGTTLWSLVPSGPMRRGDVLRGVNTEQTPSPVSADLFYVEYGRQVVSNEWPPTTIRATTLDGRQLWTRTLQGHVKHVAADARGGLIVVTGTEFHGSLLPNFDCYPDDQQSVQRLDGGTGETRWEYLQQAKLSEVAIHPNGSVFVAEMIQHKSNLLVLDVDTGQPTARLDLGSARSTRFVAGAPEQTLYPANVTAPIIRNDGTIVLTGYSWDVVSTCPDETSVCQEISYTEDLRLFEISPDALAPTSTPIGLQAVPNVAFKSWQLDRTVPDGHDGFLLVASGMIYRIGVDDALMGPLPTGVFPGEVQLVVGDDAAYALAQYEPQTLYEDVRLVAFDPASLAVLSIAGPQDLPGSPHLAIQSSLRGGGVFVSGASQQQQYIVNAASPGFVFPTLGSATTLNSTLWVGWLPGELPALQVGSELSGAGTEWMQSRGNRQGSNAPYRPRVTHFVPVTELAIVPQPYLSSQWVASVMAEVNQGQLNIDPTFRIDQEAKASEFLSVVTQTSEVVVFIGHSVLISEHPEWGSVGLRFADKSIVKSMQPEQPIGPGPATDTIIVDRIESRTKIVFVAACDPGTIFKSLWNIDETTTDRALIVPESPEAQTDLYISAGAWVHIAKALGKGKNVTEAVNAGNTWLTNTGRSLRFRVIGGANVLPR